VPASSTTTKAPLDRRIIDASASPSVTVAEAHDQVAGSAAGDVAAMMGRPAARAVRAMRFNNDVLPLAVWPTIRMCCTGISHEASEEVGSRAGSEGAEVAPSRCLAFGDALKDKAGHLD
jgi:hypothetical protein